jgi:ribosomal protein L29
MENVGLTTGDKRIREFTAAMVDLKDKVSPAMAADIAKVLEQFTIVGEALDAKKSVEEYKKALEELEESLLKLSLDKTPLAMEGMSLELDKQLADIEVKLKSLRGLEAYAQERGPGKQGYEAIASMAVVSRGVEDIKKKIEDVKFNKWADGLDETSKSALEFQRYIDTLVKKIGKDGVAAIQAWGDELNRLNLMADADKVVDDVQKQIDTLNQSISRSYYGIPDEYAAGLRDLDNQIAKYGANFDQFNVDRISNLKKELLDLIGAVEFGKLGKELFTTITTALTDAFARGEKISKVWASVVSDIFRQQMSKAINKLGDMLQNVLSTLFSNIGAGGGAAAIGGGLVAIGAMILSNLQAKKESTVEDFSDAINSSEAIRGVVAGPTNIAISKIGEQLKTALFTTEMLLERIARGVEFGGTGGQSNGTLNSRNMAYPLTSSS